MPRYDCVRSITSNSCHDSTTQTTASSRVLSSQKAHSVSFSFQTKQIEHSIIFSFDYKNRFTKSIEILKKKEEICDIKISEFIEKNIIKHKLFFTQNHPTTCVFIHCVNQILSILGYNHKYDEFSYPINICNLMGEWPHTSYDIAYWNFEYNVSNVNNNWYNKHITAIYNNYNC